VRELVIGELFWAFQQFEWFEESNVEVRSFHFESIDKVPVDPNATMFRNGRRATPDTGLDPMTIWTLNRGIWVYWNKTLVELSPI
jgi:hypothetical protein